MIISAAYEWLPNVKEQLSKAAEEANGAPCTVEFEGWDADDPEASAAASAYI